jgi:cytochrome P450
MQRVPARQAVPALARDPLAALERIGARSGGEIVRLSLGAVRPYLLTNPDHVQRVLRERPTQYVRDGMLWKPLRRLEGDGIASDGPSWDRSRQLLQPIFTTRSIAGVLDAMAEAIVAGVDELAADARAGRRVELIEGMTRVVFRALIRAFFSDRISPDEAGRLGGAISTAFSALGWRIVLPFAPDWVRLPGDRAFARAVREIDEITYPHVRRARDNAGGHDILSLLAAARDERGEPLTDRQVRDDVVSMFVAGTEATALTMAWLWLLLDAHDDVAGRVVEEVDRVVGGATPAPAHLGELTYTRMVLQETMRLFPAGWLIPRTVAEPDVMDGVRLPAGATVLVSPYVMHRLPGLWPNPDRFEPERFGPQQGERRHRYAYLPFGGGVHQCLGNHLFVAEAQLIVAAVLTRYRPELVDSGPIAARATAALRPRRAGALVLRPR